ncbi:cysteine dioxygenase type 1 [Condylostylus longicornis]|uniref:cysteine dioxygenase type 1 n=1 Tax=Condylostylus longicornis TaxID=2530218 RepID=UPI00244E1887|nr:cysteine dioxygenase type 1 [Condylostylus longicornis]
MSLSKIDVIAANINNNNNHHHHQTKEIVEEQEKYLREATQYFRGIEKPLKLGPIVNTLQELIDALYVEFESNYVNIEMVNHLMLSYKSNPKEWQKFAKWDRYKYTRNLVDAGNGKFNLMILCWNEGQASAIHDHADSHCFMKMLQGELCEIRYDWPTSKEILIDNNACIGFADETEMDGANELKEIGRATMGLNDVRYINDNLGLHRVENLSHTDGAISLHLYCPPFNSCSVFQKNSGKRMKCPVTFWSKYGVRQDKSTA